MVGTVGRHQPLGVSLASEFPDDAGQLALITIDLAHMAQQCLRFLARGLGPSVGLALQLRQHRRNVHAVRLRAFEAVDQHGLQQRVHALARRSPHTRRSHHVVAGAGQVSEGVFQHRVVGLEPLQFALFERQPLAQPLQLQRKVRVGPQMTRGVTLPQVSGGMVKLVHQGGGAVVIDRQAEAQLQHLFTQQGLITLQLVDLLHQLVVLPHINGLGPHKQHHQHKGRRQRGHHPRHVGVTAQPATDRPDVGHCKRCPRYSPVRVCRNPLICCTCASDRSLPSW